MCTPSHNCTCASWQVSHGLGRFGQSAECAHGNFRQGSGVTGQDTSTQPQHQGQFYLFATCRVCYEDDSKNQDAHPNPQYVVFFYVCFLSVFLSFRWCQLPMSLGSPLCQASMDLGGPSSCSTASRGCWMELGFLAPWLWRKRVDGMGKCCLGFTSGFFGWKLNRDLDGLWVAVL